MELWTAFGLGFIGSLHCAGMCGPLVLALPVTGPNYASYAAGRVVYHLGRIGIYALLGVIFGVVGKTLVLAGFQRWVSLGAGVAILMGLAASSRLGLKTPVFKTVHWLKSGFAKLLQRRSMGSLFLLGGLNGLLPCGLVYAACAGAVATGGILTATQFMLVFGLGTIPMMLGLSLAARRISFASRLQLQKLVPVGVALVAVLLILRGLSLGIPYISPVLGTGGACPACH